MPRSFVHLHVHSDFSLHNGAVKIADLVARAAGLGMPSLALTDGGNLFGAVEFYDTAIKAGVKPILGMEAYVCRGSRFDKTPKNRRNDHLILLAETAEGFRNLLKLSTAGYLDGFYYVPRVDYELLEEHAAGILALSSGMSGAVSRELLAGRPRPAAELAGRLKEIFGGRFLIELQDHGIAHQRALLPELVDTARKIGASLVATSDVHYLKREDAEAQEIHVLVGEQRTIQDPNRFRAGTEERYFKSAEEMERSFSTLPEALDATLAIAERVQVKLDFDRLLLPEFPLPEGFVDRDAFLRHLALQGLHFRYPAGSPELELRLDFELGIIAQMGYSGYFLIVRDFIHHAKSRGIAVGPGRGSAAGSLVAYCLGITDIDPIRFGLLFERFLNPERVSMPDIDVDFDYRRRGEVIDYVKRKYGDESVTQIITFGTMAARGVIRDVGRALGMEYGEVDRIAKLVPAELGITLEDALAREADLLAAAEADQVHTKLLQVARRLEGLVRHASTHAAGVLIAPGRLDDVVPLYRSNKGEVCTQWDMKSVEKIGLLKMDFLGLKTLTLIEDSLDLIRERTGTRPDLAELSLEDAETFATLRSAQTVGVFQLESSGMRDLLRRLAPAAFEDIIAVNALYRPGPMGSGMMNEFIECRHKAKTIRYEHPSLEPILSPTYGMMVYQEQVMQVASRMAGFSLGDADVLRRAMGKKNKEEMAAQEERFVAGAIARGTPETVARKVFGQMEYFAGYGFNKSHSAAYALLSYQTAYLKTHYPAEFMAATLGCEMESTDRIMVLVEECRRMHLSVLPPDVNTSRTTFSVVEGAIRFGLGAVKNVGEGAILALVAERERGGPFRSLLDLTRRVNHLALNRRVLESLVAAGALDSLHPSRARQFEAVATALEAGARAQAEKASGQTILFDDFAETEPTLGTLPDVPEWDRNSRLRREKEVLGFFLTEHPLDAYRDEIAAVATGDTARLRALSAGSDVRLLGVVSGLVRKTDKKGRPMGFLTVEDHAGSLECVLFADVFEAARACLETDRVVLVRGRLDRREGEGMAKIVATEVIDFETKRGDLDHTLYVRVPLAGREEKFLAQLGDVLSRYPGRGDVVLSLETGTGRRVRMRAQRFRVGVHPDLLAELRGMLGADAVRLGEATNGRKGR